MFPLFTATGSSPALPRSTTWRLERESQPTITPASPFIETFDRPLRVTLEPFFIVPKRAGLFVFWRLAARGLPWNDPLLWLR